MSLIEELVNVIAPHECVLCSTEGDLLCPNCSVALLEVPGRCYRCQRPSEGFRTCARCRKQTPLYSVRPATVYEGAAKVLLGRLKFERAKAAANTVARILAERCDFPAEGVITYIPTANARVRMRGYDQAAVIARSLARQTGLSCVPLLARVGHQRQLGKQREVRKQQMHDAFRPIHAASLQKAQIILIDDVLTTGATCEAAARVLHEVGAARVQACVFAVA
jgi:ComF family protein